MCVRVCLCVEMGFGSRKWGLVVSLRGVNTSLHAGRTDPGEVQTAGGERRGPRAAPRTGSRPQRVSVGAA